MAKFSNKRHTRFAYVHRLAAPSGDCFRNRVPSEASLLRCISRIGPCQRQSPRRRQYGLDLIGQWLVPFGSSSPLPGRSLRTDLARFLASSNDTFGQTKIVIRFSPAAGSVCNLPSQRALHPTGRTHLPPQNAEIIPRPPATRQLPAPARTGTRRHIRRGEAELAQQVATAVTRCARKTNSARTARNQVCGNHPKTPQPATLRGNESGDHQQLQTNQAIGNQWCNKFRDFGKESNTLRKPRTYPGRGDRSHSRQT